MLKAVRKYGSNLKAYKRMFKYIFSAKKSYQISRQNKHKTYDVLILFLYLLMY